MAKLSPVFNDAQLDNNHIPIKGGRLFTWAVRSMTKVTAYKYSDERAQHTNPIILNARGEPDFPIYLSDNVAYRFGLAPANDLSDPPQVLIRDIDDVQGINDIGAIAVSEWVQSGLTPTFVSVRSFTLQGDQTTAFHQGRRVKVTLAAGTEYGTVSKSAFTSLTTVTLHHTSADLDSGLSAVSLGIISHKNTSQPLDSAAILSWNSPLAPHEGLVLTVPTFSSVRTVADKIVVEDVNGKKAVLITVDVTANITLSGAGGLDVGSEAASANYYKWVIWNGVEPEGLLSLSATAPTLPPGYTHKGLSGYARNGATSNFVTFNQQGESVIIFPIAVLTGGSAITPTSVSLASAIPPQARKVFVLQTITPMSATSVTGRLWADSGGTLRIGSIGFVSTGAAALMRSDSLINIITPQTLWYDVNDASADLDLDVLGFIW